MKKLGLKTLAVISLLSSGYAAAAEYQPLNLDDPNLNIFCQLRFSDQFGYQFTRKNGSKLYWNLQNTGKVFDLTKLYYAPGTVTVIKENPHEFKADVITKKNDGESERAYFELRTQYNANGPFPDAKFVRLKFDKYGKLKGGEENMFSYCKFIN
ncbi:hypothetical protein NMR92_001382 [Vibrio cholerae]|uniref:Uncharacterized protein n=1 Tax=Vibrio parahaemolyticus TaxID=670 RepID=A0A1B1LRD8_VIBPH|nr:MULTISPECIES: hypothetical protein [Vibrio]EJL6490482.1 hypothetical protein [Vibrio cholerae]ANS55601.1 hypothetical protein [Vibrio parahaemolyticus]EJL6642173.1 hypothetical protein [Vibrio cholerae]MBL4245299.1 hypothetical protein [Vibrio fluvialis]MBL4254225.1 hypothetical protein [Vibrio fluvialis]